MWPSMVQLHPSLFMIKLAGQSNKLRKKVGRPCPIMIIIDTYYKYPHTYSRAGFGRKRI